MSCIIAPTENAIKTESKIPKIISVALSVLIYSPSCKSESLLLEIFIIDITTAAPKSSNTIDTVVEVGIPRLLKISSSMISVIITAINMIIISLK